jgi:hypothetical protein
MKNRIIINEEIERVRLLMGYTTNKTLSENLESTRNKTFVINEGVGTAAWETLFKDIAKVEGGAGLRSSVEAAIKDWGGIGVMSEKGIYYTSRDADEIVRAMEKGTISSFAEAGKLAKSMFTKSGSIEIKAAAADAIVSMPSFAKKYEGMTREQMVQALQKGPKYTKEEAEALAKRFEQAKGGKLKPDPVKPKPDPVKPKPDPGPVPPLPPNRPPWWRRTWDWLTKTKWGRRVLIAGSLLAAYLLWNSLTDDDDLAPCLKGYVKDEKDFETYLNNGYLTIEGIKIYPDGTAEMAGRKGKWVDNGTDVTVTIEGVSKTIVCKEPQPIETTTTTRSGSDPYTPCSSFPYEKFCKSDKIKEIQKCLGLTADGKLGPGTEKALKAKGYSVPLTQSDYDKIMANCGGSSVTTTTTSYTGGEMGSIENFV